MKASIWIQLLLCFSSTFCTYLAQIRIILVFFCNDPAPNLVLCTAFQLLSSWRLCFIHVACYQTYLSLKNIPKSNITDVKRRFELEVVFLARSCVWVEAVTRSRAAWRCWWRGTARWCGGRCAATAGGPWRPWWYADSWAWASPATLSRWAPLGSNSSEQEVEPQYDPPTQSWRFTLIL